MRTSLPIVCLAVAGVLAAGVYLAAPGQERQPSTPSKAQPANATAVVQKAAPKAEAKDAPAVKSSGWIGVMLEETKGEIKVANVFPGGPAAFAGVRVGDTVVKVGAKAPATAAAAAEAIEALAPMEKTTLSVKRNGRPLELTVHIGSLREFHEHYAREMSRRDPRDPAFADNHGVSAADMQVEVVRRLFEQNQRLESKLDMVLEELKALKAAKGK